MKPFPLINVKCQHYLGMPKVAGIYFLCEKDQVVYVGKTTNLHLRMIDHRFRYGKKMRCYYLECPVKELAITEHYWIAHLRPRDNATFNPDKRRERLPIRVTLNLPTKVLAKLRKIAKKITPKGGRCSSSAAIRFLLANAR